MIRSNQKTGVNLKNCEDCLMQKIQMTLVIGIILFSTHSYAQSKKNDSRLQMYKNTSEIIELQNFGEDLSGVTYNYDTDTYFVIQNKTAVITELSKDFKKTVRRIELKNIIDTDTEGIVYLGNNEFAISSEEKNLVTLLTIKPDEKMIDLNPTNNKNIQLMYLPEANKRNRGLEGVCFARKTDSQSNVLFAVQEDKPKRLFKWMRPATKDHITDSSQLQLKEPIDIEKIYKHLLNDLSDCTFDDLTGNIILLSHESSRAVEFNSAGALVSQLELPRTATQYEGITIGRGNELILASEPNIIVIMKPTAETSTTTTVK